MKFLIFPAVPSDELDLINAGAGQCEVVNAASLSEAETHIADADGFYGALTSELFAQAGKLRWVQAPVAGVEHFVFPALAESDVVFTNMAGIYSDVIADHALTYLLMFARGFHVYRTAQAQRVWDKNAPVRHLADCTVAVVGLGGIGMATAKRAKARGFSGNARTAAELADGGSTTHCLGGCRGCGQRSPVRELAICAVFRGFPAPCRLAGSVRLQFLCSVRPDNSPGASRQ